MNDYLTVTVCLYVDDEAQGNHKFKFSSHEAIFLGDICEVMYRIIIDPSDAEIILFNSTVSIEYMKE